jgi:hypothetical protein
MKVRYTGNGYNLNNTDHYEVLDTSTTGYKIRNDNGCPAWYVKTNFVEVKERVSVSTTATNSISSDLVNKIEKELKDTEQRMADLRKQLEDAKAPPTNNILLRETRQNPEWMYDADFEIAIVAFSDTLGEAVPSLTKNISFGITNEGDAIALDRDYKWELKFLPDGRQVLMILDR